MGDGRAAARAGLDEVGVADMSKPGFYETVGPAVLEWYACQRRKHAERLAEEHGCEVGYADALLVMAGSEQISWPEAFAAMADAGRRARAEGCPC